jgi:hypothetical protein
MVMTELNFLVQNLDTDLPVDLPDTLHQLFIAAGGIEQSSIS